MYTIYHIPGKKIGVTRNLNSRVTKQQGYKPGEYEVLFSTDDISEISQKEIELQKSYGYKVDRQSYKNLITKNKKMNINATEQTSTFPVPLNKLKGQLMDNLDLVWSTSHGNFKITKEVIPWLLKNARTSMFNDNRCYVYNKAFDEATKTSTIPKTVMFDKKKKKKKNKPNVYDLIRIWATEKGIYKSGDSRTQYIKLMEEAGELAEALLKNDETEVIDAIGDMVVVLTNLAKLRGHNIEDCVASAYDVIKSRQGKMVNGTFVKNNYTSTSTATL
jgi:NTP pyrophosphatase (non-canonical NTP hydrolase)